MVAALEVLFDLGTIVPGLEAGEDGLGDQFVLGEFFADGSGKVLFEPDQVEDVADVEQAEELVFGHDLAVFAETGRFEIVVLVHGRGLRIKILERQRSDVRHIGSISLRLFVGLKMLGKSLEILFFAFTGRIGRVAVVEPQLGNMLKAVRGTFDCNSGHY